MTNARQGEIFWVHLDPVRGSEQAGKRPAVIISGDTLNGATNIRIVCALTTRIRGSTGRVTVPKIKENGLKQDSDVIVFQVRAVSVERIGKKIGKVTAGQLEAIIVSLGDLLAY